MEVQRPRRLLSLRTILTSCFLMACFTMLPPSYETSRGTTPMAIHTLSPSLFTPVPVVIDVVRVPHVPKRRLSISVPTPKPQAVPKGTTTAGTGSAKKVLKGEASWGPFKGHVVTRFPRGTRIKVCGPKGCTPIVRSWGYGPAQKTHRIADLDVHVFEKVCAPRGIGVCDITLYVYGG